MNKTQFFEGASISYDVAIIVKLEIYEKFIFNNESELALWQVLHIISRCFLQTCLLHLTQMFEHFEVNDGHK